MDKSQRLQNLLNLQLNWIQAADAKVTALFAINTAMLGVIAALAKNHNNWNILESVFVSISTLLLLGSVGALACVLFPRLDGPRSSNIFFGGIANQDKDQYTEKILKAKSDSFDQDFASQIHRNSEIALAKYKYIKYGFVFTFVCLPLWLAAIYNLYGA